jgi:hypothetical protein
LTGICFSVKTEVFNDNANQIRKDPSMRKVTAVALLLLIGFLFVNGCACCKAGRCPAVQGKVLRHVVLFAWKDGTAPDKIREIEQAFAALPDTVDEIAAFEWGTDVSVENLAQGYTHAFLVTFKDEDARAAYLPHPDHQQFVALIKPHMEKVLVIDYWTR